MAGDKAHVIGAKDWVRLVGLWSTLGKYRPAFQPHIKQVSGIDPGAHEGRIQKSRLVVFMPPKARTKCMSIFGEQAMCRARQHFT